MNKVKSVKSLNNRAENKNMKPLVADEMFPEGVDVEDVSNLV